MESDYVQKEKLSLVIVTSLQELLLDCFGLYNVGKLDHSMWQAYSTFRSTFRSVCLFLCTELVAIVILLGDGINR